MILIASTSSPPWQGSFALVFWVLVLVLVLVRLLLPRLDRWLRRKLKEQELRRQAEMIAEQHGFEVKESAIQFTLDWSEAQEDKKT